MKIIELHRSVLDVNDRTADRMRNILKEKGILLINLMSSPGSGKTTLLEATAARIGGRMQMAVLEADLESAADAERMERAGIRSVQVHTDGMCHMDAVMTETALNAVSLDGTDLVFLENVGNLICPAEYDTGAGRNVMILSVPEGDDKPLKYPLMFEKSDVLILSKIDTVPWFPFDMAACEERVRRLNPGIRIFTLSAKTGEGMDEWIEWLCEECAAWKKG